MTFLNQGALVLVPDQIPLSEAYQRTTHLGIGAHADDLELMAFHGIRLCYKNPDLWFGGVTCTNGRSSARTGSLASVTDDTMVELRRKEQNRAAILGKYSFMAQLDYASEQVKDPQYHHLEDDLEHLLKQVHPQVVYTHNLADKHETHVGVAVAVIRALRRLPQIERPATIYGCEVWRDLDWLEDSDKIALDVTDTSGLGRKLVDVFQSQIRGGKRYDRAALARSRANATFYKAHDVDEASQLTFAMDLSPLVHDESLDILTYVRGYITRFQQDVETKLNHHLGIRFETT